MWVVGEFVEVYIHVFSFIHPWRSVTMQSKMIAVQHVQKEIRT